MLGGSRRPVSPGLLDCDQGVGQRLGAAYRFSACSSLPESPAERTGRLWAAARTQTFSLRAGEGESGVGGVVPRKLLVCVVRVWCVVSVCVCGV